MKDVWYIILNPRAGSGKTMSEWLPAEKKLEKFNIPFVAAYTGYRRHAIELAENAAAEGYRKILAVGGDGCLHEVFTGIMKFCDRTGTPSEEFYLGVAPIGSGNDWIKSLYVDRDVMDVVKLIRKGYFGQMDVVKIFSADGNVSYMANVGGTGFDSHVCKRANLQKTLGWRNKFIYLRALIYTIFHTKELKLKVNCDKLEIFSGECYSIALGNGKYSGGGMRQVPEAKINDGYADIMIAPKLPISTLLKEIPSLFKGNLGKNSKLVFGKGKEIEIIPLEEAFNDIIEVDGEIEGNLPATVKVSGSKINVIKGKNLTD